MNSNQSREMFSNRNKEILNFVAKYGGCVKKSHIETVFKRSSKNIQFLQKHKRLHDVGNDILSNTLKLEPNKGMIAALTVLCAAIDGVVSHATANFPALISFLSKSGGVYEILYARHGNETGILVDMNVSTQKNVKKSSQTLVKRIVILDDASQMETVNIPDTMRFAVIQPDGELAYYNKKVEG